MNVFPKKSRVTRLAFDENSCSVFLADGRILSVPRAFFPRLLQADKRQREHYEFSGGGTGIHWDDLDEDISMEGLLFGVGDRTRRQLDPSRQSE